MASQHMSTCDNGANLGFWILVIAPFLVIGNWWLEISWLVVSCFYYVSICG